MDCGPHSLSSSRRMDQERGGEMQRKPKATRTTGLAAVATLTRLISSLTTAQKNIRAD
jgi:hypothetical protein